MGVTSSNITVVCEFKDYMVTFHKEDLYCRLLNMFSSFVKIKSKIEGAFWDLYLVGSFTCWGNKLSLKHFKKSVETRVSFSLERVLFKSISLILKSSRISKCDGFPPDISVVYQRDTGYFHVRILGIDNTSYYIV